MRFEMKTEITVVDVELEENDEGDVLDLVVDGWYVLGLTRDGKIQLYGDISENLFQVDENNYIIVKRDGE